MNKGEVEFVCEGNDRWIERFICETSDNKLLCCFTSN